jgi:RNA polymerase sigma-70 factor (ECF subfamily)
MHHFLFERYVLAVKDKMFRFACSMLGNTEDARDTVQDALMKIWSQKEQLAGIHNPEAWCMQITKNLCLDRYKALKVRMDAVKHIKALQEETVRTPYDHTERKDKIERVRKIMNELPEKPRMIIHLREVEGYSYKEIADILGQSMEEVKTGLFRARKLLKERIVKNKAYGLS